MTTSKGFENGKKDKEDKKDKKKNKNNKKDKKFVMTALEDENNNDNGLINPTKEKEDQKCQP